MSKLILIASLFLALLLSACQETEDGCLDLLSSNYNFNAVTECDSCCTYPNVRFNYRIDFDTLLSRGLIDTFFLENSDSLMLILHNMKLSTGAYTFVGSNESYRVIDSLRVGNTHIRDDYILAEAISSYAIGQVRYAGQTSAIQFSVGIDADVVDTWGSLDNIDQDSGLDMLLDSMYITSAEEVAMMRMRLQVEDSIRQLFINSDKALNFDFPINKFNDAGEDISFNIRVDLKTLTDGISESLTNEEIEAIVADKIAASISVE